MEKLERPYSESTDHFRPDCYRDSRNAFGSRFSTQESNKDYPWLVCAALVAIVMVAFIARLV